MAALPCRSTCIASMFLMLTLLAGLPADGVFIKDKRKHHNTQSGERRRGSKEEPSEDAVMEKANAKKQREPFQRTVVLCNYDAECGRKFFCHGGEGHKSCLPCRKSRRRCNRDGMCCQGRVCMEGKCVPSEMRYDASYHRLGWQSIDSGEEESISQHTKEIVRKRREGETCTTGDSCDDGLCCAQHFWSRICKRILEEGDVCTKKRDRLTSMFQRCRCGKGLSCKRDIDASVRIYSCHVVKALRRKESDNKYIGVEDTLDEEESLFDEERLGGIWDTREQSDIEAATYRTDEDDEELDTHLEIETQHITIL